MISIIVLAHNKVELTRRCLEAVCRSRLPHDWELLCVDNGSTESLEGLADDFGSRPIAFQMPHNSENLSFSQANNRAAVAARGQQLVFLNNDVIVSEDALSHLIEALEGETDAGVAGGKLLYLDTGLVQHAGIAQMLWGYASNFGVGAAPDHPVARKRREMFAVTGAMMAVDRSVFESIGGFDENYRWGYEDLDICLKARYLGRRVLYIPEAVGSHDESATLKQARIAVQDETNYRWFRNVWEPWLAPPEIEYLDGLHGQEIRRVVIFGTGRAAEGLFRVLTDQGISVAAFAWTRTDQAGSYYCALPVVPLDALPRVEFDRLMVGSQYYFQLQPLLSRFDPQGDPLFPVLW